jgi:hypothetical protein
LAEGSRAAVTLVTMGRIHTRWASGMWRRRLAGSLVQA